MEIGSAGSLRSDRGRAATDPARRLTRHRRAPTATCWSPADGREVAVDAAVHLPPVEPTKIICVHLNYASRVQEFMTTAAAGADVLPQADHRAQRPRRRRRAARAAAGG